MPSVSVVIPNYNHALFLKQRIESVLNQTFQDFELILIDDCSTDGSREIMESYRTNPHTSHIIYNEHNSGSAFMQWDKGIALAKGDWVWVAESDDYAVPTFLERMMEEVAKVPDCVLAYAATWWVDKQGNKLWETPDGDKVTLYPGSDFIRKKLATNNSIANVSECLFRRECYRPTEAYRYEKMRLCGDWFFYVLLAEQGSVIELEKPLSYYRQHGSNISEEAEHRGLTFFEGADILEYMIAHCSLKTSDYARGWGRLWAKYERHYRFSPEVRKEVRRQMLRLNCNIFFFHLIYKQIYKKRAHGNN